MRRILNLFLILSFIGFASCYNCKKEKNLSVEYKYDYRLNKIGTKWEAFNIDDSLKVLCDSLANKSVASDSTIVKRVLPGRFGKYELIHFSKIDSITKYNPIFNNSKGLRNKFNLILCGGFKKNKVKIFNEKVTLYENEISTERSSDIGGGLLIDKTNPAEMTISIDNNKIAKIKLDYRFDFGYLSLSNNSISITFTNYARLMD
jgi:hypothetical protein